MTARAQQPAMLVVGILSGFPSNYIASRMPSFRQGLNESGFIEGRNVTIDYRFAEGHNDRLSSLAYDLIDHNVTVIVTPGIDPSRAVKAATTTIPIVLITDVDPVSAGLVTSLNRPEGNVTGISLLGTALEAKRLGLLNEMVPGATSIGVLINPRFPDAALEQRALRDEARVINRPLNIVPASTEPEIDLAFAALAQQGVGALLVVQDTFFDGRRKQLLALSASYRLPTMSHEREFAEEGGLVTYAPDFADGYRQAGVYAGKIIKGAKPADLPVVQPTKFELVINLKTANALGLDIPPTLLAAAEVVE